MPLFKRRWITAWLLGAIAFTCVLSTARAQESDAPATREDRTVAVHQRLRDADEHLERGLMRRAIEAYEEVIEAARALRETAEPSEDTGRLQRWEERAQLQIATARIRQQEPALARRRLEAISRDESLSAAARQRAHEGLAALRTPPTEEEEAPSGPFDLSVGTALLVAFGILEAALLTVGLSLLAAGWCEDPPTFMLTTSGCDYTLRDFGIGFGVAGSVWWIAPAIVGGFMGAARRGVGTPHPEASLGPTLTF